MNLIEKVFGTHSERELKMINPIVDKIQALRPEMIALSDEQLKDRTRIFKERLAEGETLVGGCQYIYRGYENIGRDFRELGARVASV